MRATPSTRSRSSAARTASRASASSRRSSRSSRPKARRPTASSLASNVEEKPTGQLSAVGRLFEPREVRRPARRSPEQLHGQGPGSSTPSINWSRYSKSVQLGFTEPYFLDKPILLGGQHLPARLQQLQLRRQRPQHDLFAAQHRRRIAARLPGHRILELRRPLHRWSTTRSRSTRARSTPTRTATGPLPPDAIRSRPAAICATKSARA